MTPNTTNGATVNTLETSSYKLMLRTLDYDPSTVEYAQFDIVFPKSMDRSAGFIFQPYWSHAVTTTNFDVVWKLATRSMEDINNLENPLGTAQSVTDTGGIEDVLYIGAESSPVFTASDPGYYYQCRIYRDATNGSDNLAIDARLHGVTLFFNTIAGTDD